MTTTVSEGNITPLPDPASDDAVIRHALKILESRSRSPEWYVQGTDEVKNYLRVRLAAEHGRECLFAHNQPPGGEAWSLVDQQLVSRLAGALAPVGVRVLDYFLVGNEVDVYSFRDHGRV